MDNQDNSNSSEQRTIYSDYKSERVGSSEGMGGGLANQGRHSSHWNTGASNTSDRDVYKADRSEEQEGSQESNVLKDVVQPTQEKVDSKEVSEKVTFTKGSVSKPRKFPKIRIPRWLVFILAALILLVTVLLVVLKPEIVNLNGLLGGKVEIVWWGVQFDESSLVPLINKYEADNPNVDIEYVKQSPVDYRERLTNALASGKGPDIFEIHNSWPVMFKNELSTLPSDVMSQVEFTKTFYPVVVSDMTTKNGIVGIPLEFDAITLYINEDIFRTSAKSPPKTWDDLKDLSIELTQRGGNNLIIQSGASLGLTENVDHWPEIIALMMIQNGATLSNPSSKYAEDALLYYSLFAKDGVWDEKLPSSTVAFAKGDVAMYIGPARRAFEITRANPGLKYKTVPLPQVPKELPDEPDVSYATYWVQGVWERSKARKEGWNFLKYMSERSSLDLLYKNIEISTNIQKLSPRIDSANILIRDPIVGSILTLATSAKSWYLVDDTNDGSSGINSQINSIFDEVLGDGVVGSKKSLDVAAGEIQSLLAQYGLPVR